MKSAMWRKLESTMPLAQAEKQPLTTERLREQLGPAGRHAVQARRAEERTDGRSDAARQRVEPPAPRGGGGAGTAARAAEAVAAHELGRRQATVSNFRIQRRSETPHVGAYQNAKLIVLVRNLAQLEAALQCGVETVYCDFENPKKYREAVTLFHTARGCVGIHPSTSDSPPSIWVAPPRIFKMGEEWTLNQVRSCNADGYLVRNYDHLKFFANDRRVGDFSLNIANRLAADYFKNRFGLERVTASYDLNFQQLEALLTAAPPEWFEITIHQHMPMFHMEHCVFCAFLSSGTDYTNCGRPCDVHDVKLRDRVGAEHPLKADVGCRNTVFNALAQTGAEYVERMLALGVRHFRVEFLNETPEQVDANHHEVSPAAARRNHRRATVARVEAVQPTRRHARPDGRSDGGLNESAKRRQTVAADVRRRIACKARSIRLLTSAATSESGGYGAGASGAVRLSVGSSCSIASNSGSVARTINIPFPSL